MHSFLITMVAKLVTAVLINTKHAQRSCPVGPVTLFYKIFKNIISVTKAWVSTETVVNVKFATQSTERFHLCCNGLTGDCT